MRRQEQPRAGRPPTQADLAGRAAGLRAEVQRVVAGIPVLDIHTHLYDPALGALLLWGIDELLVYHYLVAETFRHGCGRVGSEFWRLSKTAQADLVWRTLFQENSPLSEACRGVLTTLHRLGLDAHQRDLPALRRWFAGWKVEAYVDRCLELAGVRGVVMTNSPFDELEGPAWLRGWRRDSRFQAALRIDPLLLNWPVAARQLAEWGYRVRADLGATTCGEVRRFLADWSRRLQARYLMVSLPPDFQYPARAASARLIEQVVLPHCQESGLPFALMLGVRRAVNPALQLAGDGVGSSDLAALANLCAAHAGNKFLVTVLARENQHELCVLARKFPNLHIFGCWWFTNVPVLVEEITRLRVELLGLSFTAQHSDARVLDQVIYKWDHARAVVAQVLADEYVRLAATGWTPAPRDIERDAQQVFGGAFERFCRG